MTLRQNLSLRLLTPNQPEEPFPPVSQAWDEPNGLLAVGGDLSTQRMINAYRQGIFPWFGPREPIYWWSPDPRAVLIPEHIRITRSLRKSMRNKGYQIHINRNFPAVVRACAAPRSYTDGTWITDDMFSAYCRLHQAGLAHSVEIYDASGLELVGGLYGVAVTGIFCGESMFSREPDTSKIALTTLAWHVRHWGFTLIDCQIANPHLRSMGSETMSRSAFMQVIATHPTLPANIDWQLAINLEELSHWEPGAA